MKYKASAAFGIGMPHDADDNTKLLGSLITDESVRMLYNKLPTSRMKFVVAAHFELGYSQQMIADILGITQPSLQDEIKHIKRVLLGQPYKPRKHKGTIKLEELMKMMRLLAQP